MSNDKATARPWRCRELGSEGAMIYPDCADKRESGKPVCRVDMRDTLTDFANAALIVKAVNLHDELVKALENCRDHIMKTRPQADDWPFCVDKANKLIKDAKETP